MGGPLTYHMLWELVVNDVLWMASTLQDLTMALLLKMSRGQVTLSKARLEQPQNFVWIEDKETYQDSNSLLVSNDSETDEDETTSKRRAPVRTPLPPNDYYLEMWKEEPKTEDSTKPVLCFARGRKD